MGGKSLMKYSFVMPYFHRPDVFKRTLDSFVQFVSPRDDYEIFIMESERNYLNENFHHRLISTIKPYQDKLNIKVVRVFGYSGITPAVAYNYGAVMATGSHLLFTQPEIMFLNDVLGELDKQFEQTPDSFVLVSTKWQKKRKITWKNCASKPLGDNFPFTIAMKKESYLDCSYDLIYAGGYRREDTDWRDRLRELDKPFVITDKAQVLHQQHGKAYRFETHLSMDAMIRLNKQIYFKEHPKTPGYKVPPICVK